MRKKIIIADDEPSTREAVRACLENENYELYDAPDSESTLKLARELKPDLIILDLMMPDKWGYTVCEEIKKQPETKKTRVLILTGRKSSPSMKLGEIKGGDYYMVKPFAPAELRAKVKELLGLK